MTPSRRVPTWAIRTFRLVLRAYPSAFRTRFGGSMEEAFRDRLEAAAEAGQGTGRVTIRAIAEILTAGAGNVSAPPTCRHRQPPKLPEQD